MSLSSTIEKRVCRLIQRIAGYIASGRYAKALSTLDAYGAESPAVDFLRGKALQGLGRHEMATGLFARSAVSGESHTGEAWMLAGFSFHQLGKLDQAAEAYQRAIDHDDNLAEARNNLCGLMAIGKRFSEALPHAKWLLANAARGDYCINAMLAFSGLYMWDETLAAAERVLEHKPDDPRALGIVVRAAQETCDWSALVRYTRHLSDHFYRKGMFDRAEESHFSHIAWCMKPEWNLAVAKAAAGRGLPENIECHDHARHAYGTPLRVGYVSGDFHDHPMLQLTAGLFQHHTPNRVKPFIYCHSPESESWLRRRFEASVPFLARIAHLSDEQAAARIRADKIDVLVDCQGFTKGHRLGIFARRPVPVQVTWLGFPGTTGADCMDYILSDHFVTPDGSEPHFSEYLCRMPDTYFCNDKGRVVAENKMDRAGQGLPEKGIVFCCFNKAYKLEPVRFATFMEVLRDVPGSVLWLIDSGKTQKMRLQQYASQAGIDPGRLIFGERVSAVPLHLARIALADIALDTRIYNGHTTTADALWAGVPLVAARGGHFASRVSESLLRACSLPELVVDDEAGFHKLAVDLALNPEKFLAVREKLQSQRFRAPLFDTERYARHLETAFIMMAERAAQGLPPAGLDIPAMPPRKEPFAEAIPRKKIHFRDPLDAEPGRKKSDPKYKEDVPMQHIFSDGISKITLSNNNLRVVLTQNGPDNSATDICTLILPASQASHFINSLANGFRQIDDQMKAGSEAQAGAGDASQGQEAG